MTKRTILQPEYMSRFSCIGGACEDSCCMGGWNIFIDKKTFLKYREIKDEELAEAIGKAVKRYRGKNASDQQYALFRLRADNKNCVFLTNDKLCHIVNKVGYKYLCDTCAIYPRMYKMADKKLERCATMSCPEAMRVALKNPDGIAFETVEEDTRNLRVPPRAPSINPGDAKLATKSAKYFWEIRMYCLSLLQNRLYTIGQRLIILGMICRKIDELEKEGRVDEIPSQLDKLSASVENGTLKPSLDSVEKNFEIQMRLAKELTDERLRMELVANHSYVSCVVETLAGLNIFVDTPVEDMVKKYVYNRDNYVLPYLKEKDYYMENFLVNEFFMRMMPFGSGETAFDAYITLCVIYGMIKLHLTGMAGSNNGLTDDIVFRVIQGFSKVVLHNSEFIPGMVKLIRRCGFDTQAWMAILVND